MMSDQLDW